jgi:hypothetical protein
MEFAVLLLVALAAGAYIALPRASEEAAEPLEADLLARREEILSELRDLDEDATAGRISAADRAAGRRALAPELRAVAEALRARGVDIGPAS